MSSSEALVLPEGMAKYVDADKLDENFRNHPESQRDLSEGQLLAIQEIRSRLEQLPLVHCTEAGSEEFEEKGILPGNQLPDGGVNTNTLDRHFGLDRFVFSTLYEIVFDTYGDTALVIDPQLKSANNMLVTPLDLGYMVPVGTDPKDLSEEHCKKIDEYFDSMMLGEDWMEIISRQALTILINEMRAPAHKRRDDMALLPLFVNPGEWKHYGAIKPDNIVDNSYGDGGLLVNEMWAQQGVIPVEWHISDEARLWEGARYVDDVEGIDVKELRKFWRYVGELALS